MRKLKKYTPTRFMAETSRYDKAAADYNKAQGQFDKILERIKEP